jgi:hypothetical protein
MGLEKFKKIKKKEEEMIDQYTSVLNDNLEFILLISTVSPWTSPVCVFSFFILFFYLFIYLEFILLVISTVALGKFCLCLVFSFFFVAVIC